MGGWGGAAGALAVVVGAEEAAVGLGGGAVVAVFDDVVDLAPVGGDTAAGVGAVAIAEFDGSTERPGEDAGSGADVDDARGGVEHDAFDVCFGEHGRDVAGVRTLPSASSQTRPLKVS